MMIVMVMVTTAVPKAPHETLSAYSVCYLRVSGSFLSNFPSKIDPQKMQRYPTTHLQISMVFDHANFDNFPHPIAVRNVGSAQNAIFMYTVFDHNLCDTGPPSLRRQSPPKKMCRGRAWVLHTKKMWNPIYLEGFFFAQNPRRKQCI